MRKFEIKPTKLNIKFYVESQDNQLSKLILPDMYSIDIEANDMYDICNAIYKQVEYLYNTYGIYAIPFTEPLKRCDGYACIDIISKYKIYSIMHNCELSDECDIYTYTINTDDDGNVDSITFIFSITSSQSSVTINMDNIPKSDKAILNAILKEMVFYVPTDINNVIVRNDSVFVHIETKCKLRSVLHDIFQISIKDKGNANNLIDHVYDIKKRTGSKHISISDSGIPSFYINRYKTLLIATLLDRLGIDYTDMRGKVQGFYFVYNMDKNGFYDFDSIKELHLLLYPHHFDNNLQVIDLSDAVKDENNRELVMVVHDILTNITILTEDQFRYLINR